MMNINDNRYKLLRYDYDNDALYFKAGNFEKYLGKLLCKSSNITRNQKLAAVAAKGKWIIIK